MLRPVLNSYELFSKYNGETDLFFRFTQVEIAAVSDGYTQFIECAVSQFRYGFTILVCNRPQLCGNLRQSVIHTIGIECQVRNAAGEIIHAEGNCGVGMYVADTYAVAPACHFTFATVLCKLIL